MTPLDKFTLGLFVVGAVGLLLAGVWKVLDMLLPPVADNRRLQYGIRTVVVLGGLTIACGVVLEVYVQVSGS